MDDERRLRRAICDAQIELDAIALNPRPWPLFTDAPRVAYLRVVLVTARRNLAVLRVLEGRA